MMRQFLPLFNSPLFDQELRANRLSFDSQNLWRLLEVILFPDMPCRVEEYTPSVCRITSPVYLSASPLYTHAFFVTSSRSTTRPTLPSLASFLRKIDECVKQKIPYLWGGNVPEGIDVFKQIYPVHSPLDPLSEQVFDLRGVDCSGLLYWASGGVTARNTSELIFSGQAVSIVGASSQEIAALLEPGMIIVWKGHVLVVTDKGIVESTPSTGVVLREKSAVIDELLLAKQPLDAWPEQTPSTPSFVVRNLFPVF